MLHDAAQALGLANVRHFSQLLPLLLDWLHASDAETRLLAVQVHLSTSGPNMSLSNLVVASILHV